MNWINVTGSGFSAGQFALIAYETGIGGSGYSFSLGYCLADLALICSTRRGAVELAMTNPATYIWPGAQNTNWDIGASLNWQLDGTASTYSNGDTVLFNSTGSAANQVNLTASVAPGGVTVDTRPRQSPASSGSGGLGGAGGLAKVGAGTLR